MSQSIQFKAAGAKTMTTYAPADISTAYLEGANQTYRSVAHALPDGGKKNRFGKLLFASTEMQLYRVPLWRGEYPLGVPNVPTHVYYLYKDGTGHQLAVRVNVLNANTNTRKDLYKGVLNYLANV